MGRRDAGIALAIRFRARDDGDGFTAADGDRTLDLPGDGIGDRAAQVRVTGTPMRRSMAMPARQLIRRPRYGHPSRAVVRPAAPPDSPPNPP